MNSMERRIATQKRGKAEAVGRSLHSVVLRLKLATGISCANCETCARLSREDDGNYPEQAISWSVCTKRQHVSNLKNFPFKTEQNCWEPEFWHSKFAGMIKTGEHEEILKLSEEYAEAVRVATENTVLNETDT